MSWVAIGVFDEKPLLVEKLIQVAHNKMLIKMG
jgi:hypothetical protein